MQAIARANRVNEGKNNGLIIDYCGILKNLRKALATFGGVGDTGNDGEDGEKDPVRPDDELLDDLSEAIDLVCSFLMKQGFELASSCCGKIIASTGIFFCIKKSVTFAMSLS